MPEAITTVTMNGQTAIDYSKFPNVAKGFQYAYDVRDGRVDVCVHVKNCVKRFFNDLEKSDLAVADFYFDHNKAERFLRLVQKFKHVKGQ